MEKKISFKGLNKENVQQNENRLKYQNDNVESVYYPFAAVDIGTAFDLFPNATDLVLTGSESAGELEFSTKELSKITQYCNAMDKKLLWSKEDFSNVKNLSLNTPEATEMYKAKRLHYHGKLNIRQTGTTPNGILLSNGEKTIEYHRFPALIFIIGSLYGKYGIEEFSVENSEHGHKISFKKDAKKIVVEYVQFKLHPDVNLENKAKLKYLSSLSKDGLILKGIPKLEDYPSFNKVAMGSISNPEQVVISDYRDSIASPIPNSMASKANRVFKSDAELKEIDCPFGHGEKVFVARGDQLINAVPMKLVEGYEKVLKLIKIKKLKIFYQETNDKNTVMIGDKNALGLSERIVNSFDEIANFGKWSDCIVIEDLALVKYLLNNLGGDYFWIPSDKETIRNISESSRSAKNKLIWKEAILEDDVIAGGGQAKDKEQQTLRKSVKQEQPQEQPQEQQLTHKERHRLLKLINENKLEMFYESINKAIAIGGDSLSPLDEEVIEDLEKIGDFRRWGHFILTNNCDLLKSLSDILTLNSRVAIETYLSEHNWVQKGLEYIKNADINVFSPKAMVANLTYRKNLQPARAEENKEIIQIKPVEGFYESLFHNLCAHPIVQNIKKDDVTIQNFFASPTYNNENGKVLKIFRNVLVQLGVPLSEEVSLTKKEFSIILNKSIKYYNQMNLEHPTQASIYKHIDRIQNKEITPSKIKSQPIKQDDAQQR